MQGALIGYRPSQKWGLRNSILAVIKITYRHIVQYTTLAKTARQKLDYFASISTCPLVATLSVRCIDKISHLIIELACVQLGLDDVSHGWHIEYFYTPVVLLSCLLAATMSMSSWGSCCSTICYYHRAIWLVIDTCATWT